MKPGYLIALKVTPIQDFIKEARKTQDMYSGSLLLSLMSNAMVKKLLAEQPALKLLYPVANACEGSEQKPVLTNEALAWIPDSDHVETLATDVAAAALNYFAEVADKVKQELTERELYNSQDDLWDKQIAGQFRALWATLAIDDIETPDKLVAGIREVKALLGAAKNAHLANIYQGSNARKCSQCAQWEGIGLQPQSDDSEVKFILHDKEMLCAVCLTKRLAPRWGFLPAASCFPSTASVAWSDTKTRLLTTLISIKNYDYWQSLQVLWSYSQSMRKFATAAREFPGDFVFSCQEATIQQFCKDYRQKQVAFIKCLLSAPAEQILKAKEVGNIYLAAVENHQTRQLTTEEEQLLDDLRQHCQKAFCQAHLQHHIAQVVARLTEFIKVNPRSLAIDFLKLDGQWLDEADSLFTRMRSRLDCPANGNCLTSLKKNRKSCSSSIGKSFPCRSLPWPISLLMP